MRRWITDVRCKAVAGLPSPVSEVYNHEHSGVVSRPHAQSPSMSDLNHARVDAVARFLVGTRRPETERGVRGLPGKGALQNLQHFALELADQHG